VIATNYCFKVDEIQHRAAIRSDLRPTGNQKITRQKPADAAERLGFFPYKNLSNKCHQPNNDLHK
jgi:hypothetical protein